MGNKIYRRNRNEVYVTRKDDDRLFNACRSGKTKKFKKLVKKLGEAYVASASDDSGATCLHHAAAGKGAALVRTLLSFGADADAVNDAGETPTHFAASKGNFGAISALVDAGAAIDAVDDFRSTPLRRCFRRQRHVAALTLLRGGARLSDAAAEDMDADETKALTKLLRRIEEEEILTSEEFLLFDVESSIEFDAKLEAKFKRFYSKESSTDLSADLGNLSADLSKDLTEISSERGKNFGEKTTAKKSGEKSRKFFTKSAELKSKKNAVDAADDLIRDTVNCSEKESTKISVNDSVHKSAKDLSIASAEMIANDSGIDSTFTSTFIPSPNDPFPSSLDPLPCSLDPSPLSLLFPSSSPCDICLSRPKRLLFFCKHAACSRCRRRLERCHICRKPIVASIRFAGNDDDDDDDDDDYDENDIYEWVM